jgi:ribonucleoside-diphosphate reductase alpha chain
MLELPWLTTEARQFLSLDKGYLRDQTPEERYEAIAKNIEKISKIKGIANRFRNYISKGWVSFASPVLANFGHKDNLPISCNFFTIEDSLPSILEGLTEMGMLSKYGAGVAVNFSSIRPSGSSISSGGKSEGVIPFIALYQDLIKRVSQNGVRRGFMTAYLSADHPEIMDFLEIGTDGNPINIITTGITIPEGWIESLRSGDSRKRKIWSKILKTRSEIGYPYILFEDNCNNAAPKVYKDKKMKLFTSNICSEVIEYCDKEKTFACCLSSVVLTHWDDWKDDPNFIFDMNIMLDCVIEEYIKKGKNCPGLTRAIKFAEEHRAIGLGVLGWHSLLQRKRIPIGSMDCFSLNNDIFKKIKEESDRASKWMAENWGEPEILKGYGLRNTTRIAIAPTKSTSFIMGNHSLGIEPIKSNYHMKKLAKIQDIYKNPELVSLLQEKNKDTPEVWDSILINNGSVQHLDFLTENEKNVFKTFSEVSQADLISLAAQRQKYIDQGQSLNLMFHPKTSGKDINKIILDAYDSGIKTLYYSYSISAAQEFNRKLLECTACHG